MPKPAPSPMARVLVPDAGVIGTVVEAGGVVADDAGGEAAVFARFEVVSCDVAVSIVVLEAVDVALLEVVDVAILEVVDVAVPEVVNVAVLEVVDVAVLEVVDDIVVLLAAALLPLSISTVATLTPALLSWAGDAVALLIG